MCCLKYENAGSRLAPDSGFLFWGEGRGGEGRGWQRSSPPPSCRSLRHGNLHQSYITAAAPLRIWERKRDKEKKKRSIIGEYLELWPLLGLHLIDINGGVQHARKFRWGHKYTLSNPAWLPADSTPPPRNRPSALLSAIRLAAEPLSPTRCSV